MAAGVMVEGVSGMVLRELLRAWEFLRGALRILVSPTRSLTGSCQPPSFPSPRSQWTSGDQNAKASARGIPVLPSLDPSSPKAHGTRLAKMDFATLFRLRGHKPQDFKVREIHWQ